ncbi:MAG: MobF family relaxase [Geminicoccaceae bacterium]
MLTLAVIRTPERVVDHFSAVHRYGGAMRPAVTWFGKGAALTGLRNPVDPACLLPLLDGRIDEMTLLGRIRAGAREHRPGWELMFSAPKSVSLVALAGGDERLVTAHDRAVKSALSWLEAETAYTRLGNGSKPQPHLTGCFLAVTVRHELSRAAEPHLHSRTLLINATLASPGRWRSLYTMPLFHAAKPAGIRYQQSLAEQALACGYDVCWYDNDTFELAVIPRRLALLFSSRAKAVERRLGEQSLSRQTATIRQRERATRQAEAAQRPRSLEQQRQHDRQRAIQAGLDLAAVVARARQRGKGPPLPVSATADDPSASATSIRAAGC